MDKLESYSKEKLFGLRSGDARFSPYNTIITAEVNQKASPLASAPDLFREFKWAEAAGTLVPVAFPDFYPDMTRYQAEADQIMANRTAYSWKKTQSRSQKPWLSKCFSGPAMHKRRL